MKPLKVLCCLLLCFPLALFARSIVVVDAGSSGTRLHHYDLSHDAVVQTMNVSTRPGLSFFVTESGGHSQVHEDALRAYLNQLIDQANNARPFPHQTPIYIYATAGLRSLSPHAQAALLHVTKETFKSRGFVHVQTKVISGQQEAKYDWLGINGAQLMSNPSAPTVGVIDMGGGSVELAFKLQQIPSGAGANVATIHFPNEPSIQLYARSFEGMGENYAMAQVMQTTANAVHVCYPKGTNANQSSQFDWKQCHQLIQEVYNFKQSMRAVRELMMSQAPDHFVALSGLYFTSKFLNDVPWRDWPITAKKNCGQTWLALKQQHPQEPNQYLEHDCMAAVYNEYILSSLLGVQPKQIRFSQAAGWPDGVAVAYVLGDPLPDDQG